MGRVCSVKKKKKTRGALFCQTIIQCCSVLLMYRGKLEQRSETEVVPMNIMTHVSCYTALFTCAQERERGPSTVQVVGKFWSLHNPQKLCMCQISWFSRRSFMLTETLQDLECAKVPMPAHQILPLMAYNFEAS